MPSRTARIGRATVRVEDDQPTFWARVEAGGWEPGTLCALDGLAGSGDVVLDLGAWVGPITLYAAALGARVIAVEPDPVALAQLRRNVAANPELAPLIRIVPGAIAPQPGRIALGARRKPGDSMSSALLAGSGASTWTSIVVTPAELAAMLPSSGRLVVKLDIEGGEYRLLPAIGPLLARDPALLASFHPLILSETGELDVHGATRAALAPLKGWRGREIGRGDRPLRQGLLPDVVLDAIDVETWLFDPAPPETTQRSR